MYLWCLCQQERYIHMGLAAEEVAERSHSANETIRRALGVPLVLELMGACREDAKRPDGMTLIPWEGGRALLWDFTCSDTLALSNQSLDSRGPAKVACAAEELKRRKYASLITM